MGRVSRGLIILATLVSSLAFQDSTVNRSSPPTPEVYKAHDSRREAAQKATDLLAAMQVSPGDAVADVGAGDGYYSMRLADLVGPQGTVFAEDINDGGAKARVRAFNLRNVEVVKGEIDDPKLPAGRLAAVLIVDSYHHFTNYPAMLEKILNALKPGGRLVIVDYSSREHRTKPRADQLQLHEIDPELVIAEVRQAGFRILKCDDPFAKWTPGMGITRASATDLWLMVAVRP
jgi:predicted methyltransferase